MSEPGQRTQPKISFVVCARNDNYGGNFLHRLQVFVDCLLSQWRQFDLNGELVIVEWNPPEHEIRLEKAISWPADIPEGRLRIIQVPAPVHQRLANSDRIAMFEYMAKNVGIRRSNGEYVLVTNPDIVFSHEMINALATVPLADDSFYRTDRYDVGVSVPKDLSVEERVRFCAENSVRVRSSWGTIPIKRLSPKNFGVYRGYLRKLASPRDTMRWLKMQAILRLHTGAPGDFTMMSNRSWHDLKGYPELPSQQHIDSYLCAMAKSSGLSQVVLNGSRRIYHQDHDSSEMAARPATDYNQFWEDTVTMLRSKKPMILNDEGWGLADEKLMEVTIG